MADRIDDLSDRARWFLNNFDEVDLADLCAGQEASNQTRQEALDRIRDAVALHRKQLISTAELYAVIEAHTTPAEPPQDQPPARHDEGPSVQECAEADRRYWDVEKAGE